MITPALDGAGFDAVTFDCYGTLIDWETGCLAILRPWADGVGLAAGDDALLRRLAEAQRHQQCLRPHRPYREVLGDSLGALARHFEVRLQPSARRRFAASVGDWPPFPDTVAALARLAGRFRLGVLSNVDNRSFAATRRRLGSALDVVVTADDVGSYKPEPAHFRRAIQAFAELGVEKERILHAAQSRFHDIAPAHARGLAAVWINRRHDRSGRGLTVPSDAATPHVVTGLADLAERLEA
ncbi:MAG: haloacid dehalogenase type II [Rhodospirillales bacterium]|nr:haloacid dehalogenase type II [Rhodospirillales bacterium]MDP6882933.1 haloacid dehalogenase type II [Rhodospirillales bacterium]